MNLKKAEMLNVKFGKIGYANLTLDQRSQWEIAANTILTAMNDKPKHCFNGHVREYDGYCVRCGSY